MFAPSYFREERIDVLAQAVRDIQLGMLVTAVSGEYRASHLPMVLKKEGGAFVLESHVARANDHWTVLDRPLASLATFQGPQAYVSPSWYESKREHGKVVPTWNYIAVHAHGTLEAVEDEGWLGAHLDELVSANESHREAPWAVSDAPADFVRKLSRAVVGLRLRVERLEGKWKLSQNRPEGDRIGVVAGLSASPRSGDAAVAEIMRGLETARATSA